MPALPIGEHTVVGTLSGIEPKTSGWMRFSISVPGDQYPLKVDTKKPEIIEAAKALLGQDVTVQVNVQDSGNPNENKPGTNYMNRYLNEIAPAGEAAAQQQATQQQASPGAGQAGGASPGEGQAGAARSIVPEHERTRQIRIMRQHCWANAVALGAAGQIGRLGADGKPVVTPIDLVEASEVEMTYIVYGPTRFGVQAFGSRTETPAATPTPTPQAPGPEPQQQPLPAAEAQYTCPDCGTNDPNMHTSDCIPF